jgi:hypothetical protein
MLLGMYVGLVLALCLAQPCLASETVRLKNGRVLVVDRHEATGFRTTLILPGNGRMEIETAWVEGFGPSEEFEPATGISSDPTILEADRRYSPEELQQLVRENALKFSMDEKLLVSMIRAESNFDPQAVSSHGAQGLMQLMPETASAYKVKNPFNPRENLEAGARYMKDLLQQFNQNLVLALAAYNAGPTSVLNYNGVPPFPETTRYVRKVLALKEERRRPD